MSDVNEEWGDDRQLEVVFGDGKSNREDALSEARRLVEEHDASVLYPGSCSSETLGIAPYAEENRILLLTPLSSSDEIIDAGDFIFRNYPTNAAQVVAMVDSLSSKDFKNYALITSDTDYALDLLRSYLERLQGIGGEIVADAGTFVSALHDSGIKAQGIANDVAVSAETISQFSEQLEGYWAPSALFTSAGTPEFAAMQRTASLRLGLLLRLGV